MICHEHRLIFLHLPKCGGTSIEIALTGQAWHGGPLQREQHLTAEETCRLYGDEVFRSYFKFTMVRNTWDLLVAYYLWGCSGLRGRAPRWPRWGREWGHPFDKQRRTLARLPTFPDHVANLAQLNQRLRFSHSGQDLTRQLAAISIDGSVAMDYVGRFEDLQGEFAKICRLAGLPPRELPHKLKSRRKTHYAQFYDDPLRELVQQKYQDDIGAFHFRFEQNGPRRAPGPGSARHC